MRARPTTVSGGGSAAIYGRMRTLRILVSAALLGLLALPSAAGAKTNPYTAAGVCGPGYKVIDRHRMYATDPSNGNPVLLAAVVLTYNSARGTNCAVTMKRYRVGRRSASSATISPFRSPRARWGPTPPTATPASSSTSPGRCTCRRGTDASSGAVPRRC